MNSSTVGSAEMSRRVLRLRRSGSVLTGVCSGIANYLDVDPVVIRICVVALGFTSGWVLPTYVALAFLLPADCSGDLASTHSFDGFDLVQRLKGGFNDMLVATVRRDHAAFHRAWQQQLDRCRRAWADITR